MSESRWIPVAEQAKLVRAQLKRHWPAVKFSVKSKSFSGGSSITIAWTDGPTSKQVESIAYQFKGGGFDGSIDMAYSCRHWLLPDGTAIIQSSPGTSGSLGYISPVENGKPHPKAERVSFAANYISTSRKYSLDFYSRQLLMVCERYGIKNIPAIKVSGGNAYAPNAWQIRPFPNDTTNLQDLMYRKIHKTQAAH